MSDGAIARTFRGFASTTLGAACGLLVWVLGDLVLAILDGAPLVRLAPRLAGAVAARTVGEATAVGLGAAVGLLASGGRWRAGGLVALTGLAAVVVGFLAYAVGIALPRVPEETLWLSVTLLAVEAWSLGMVVVYAFYGLDATMRRRWRRSADRVPFSRHYVPKVAFHVACFNEPPQLVAESLRALLQLDYPRDRYVVMVLDDSTDPACRAPLEAFCRENGLEYLHREDRRGFKAGALNHALARTPADVELVSVLDADYQLEDGFLRETVGYFVDPNLAFVQTPQDYRNIGQSSLTRGYYYADAYFYRAVLPARNEQNAIIFCGTMGILRRSALEAVGGWGERFITEDSELSIRILERGYDSLYVNRTYGRGLIPPTFDAYKKQLYRWSFGSVKVVKAHLKRFLFSHLSVRQKFDFLVGNFHWFDGLGVCAIAAAVALLGVAELAGLPISHHHQREVWLVGLVPAVLLVDGAVRVHAALARGSGAGFGTSMRVLGMWYAIKFNNMFAAVKSLLGFRMPFVRTPKAPDTRPSRLRALGLAVRLTRFELVCGLTLLGLGVANAAEAWDRYVRGGLQAGKLLLVAWLLFYAMIFLIAPFYAYRSFVTYLPDTAHGRQPLPARKTPG